MTDAGSTRLAVRGVLLVEPLERRRRHDAGVDAFGGQRLAGGDGELDLGAGRDEDHVGRAARRVGEDVRALDREVGGGERVAGCRAVAALEHRDVLAGQRDAGGTGVATEHLEPDDGRLVRVAGANDREVRDGAQGGELLDRLVGRAVLAERDGVVRPDEDRRDVHQRRRGGPRGACSR